MDRLVFIRVVIMREAQHFSYLLRVTSSKL